MSPLIRLMIVCVPDTMPVSMLTSSWPIDHGTCIAGTPATYLWVRSGVKPWQRRHLIGIRRSRHAPMLCAGGPIRWLDLDGMRDAAAFAAGTPPPPMDPRRARHPTGDPVAPDPHRAARHAERGDGCGVAPLHPPAPDRWRCARSPPPTSPARSSTRTRSRCTRPGWSPTSSTTRMRAICGDAILTTDGRLLQPRSDSFADRITYLHHAMRLLHTLPSRQRLLAVTPPDTATTAT